MKKNIKGFTLIELLVVIAIIGLLSTLAVVALSSARQKSRDAKRVADVKQVQTSLELFFNDQGVYPAGTTITLGTTSAACLSSTNGFAATCAGTNYMVKLPSNPSPKNDGPVGVCLTTTEYVYTQDATGASYTIGYCLGGATGGVGAGFRRATPAGLATP